MVGCVSLTRSEATNGYEVNATHGKPPHFCLVLPEEEIKGGNPYTMTVELMNVIGKDGDVNHGHPGVMYNVIDQNNFDTMHLRFVTWENPHNLGRFPFSQKFRKFRFGAKWKMFFRFARLENSQKKENCLEGSPGISSFSGNFPVG